MASWRSLRGARSLAERRVADDLLHAAAQLGAEPSYFPRKK
jgi:hypothetical protein